MFKLEVINVYIEYILLLVACLCWTSKRSVRENLMVEIKTYTWYGILEENNHHSNKDYPETWELTQLVYVAFLLPVSTYSWCFAWSKSNCCLSHVWKFQIYKILNFQSLITSYIMVCPSVRGDNTPALATGLSPVQEGKQWFNFYTIYISVDLAHYEIFHADVGKSGINSQLSLDILKIIHYHYLSNSVFWEWLSKSSKVSPMSIWPTNTKARFFY